MRDRPEVIPLAPSWHRRAACLSEPVELFYPEGQGQTKAAIGRARTICAVCPVQRQCLDWAIAHDDDGIWAGTTRQERKALKRAA